MLLDKAALQQLKDFMQIIRTSLRRTPLFNLYTTYQDEKLQRLKYQQWVNSSKPIPPPPVVKQLVVKDYAKRFRLSTFIETGTFQGGMINFVKGVFKKIYSIELSVDLYQQAQERFAQHKHIKLLQGDSGQVLGQLLPQIQHPCLFWLDGHYSEGITARGDLETPITKELEHIFKHPRAHEHVILIDDARCFNGEHDYPELAVLEKSAKDMGFDHFIVEDDIIRIYLTRKRKSFLYG